MTTPKTARAFFVARFRAVGTPARAEHDRAYLKTFREGATYLPAAMRRALELPPNG